MPKTKVLLVDDDRDLVAVLKIALQRRGYVVQAAHDAEAGLAAVASERPDCIVLDIMMPNATEGFHFVWELRQRDDPFYRNVPVLVVSAIHEKTALRFYPDSGDGTYQAGEYLPVQDFVDKPIDPDLLIDRIERAVRLAQSR